MSYDISGTVTLDASGLQYTYVQAFYDGDIVAVATTAADGTYTLSALTDAQTYTVVPTRSGYTFTPTSDDVTLAGGNETGVDFTATGVGYGVHAAPGSAELEFALHQPPRLSVDYRGEPTDLDEVVMGLGAYAEIDSSATFGGSVEEIAEIMPAGRSDARWWSVSFTGWEERLKHRLVVIEAGESAYTVQDIIDDLESQVLDSTSASLSEDISVGTIDGGATTLFYPSFIYWTAADVLDHLAELIGGYWYIDPWPRELHLRTYGATSATWALSTSQDVWNLKARRHRDGYSNVVYVTTRTSWSTEGDTEYAVTASEIEDRATVEGGSGRYESVINAPANVDTSAKLQAEAGALLADHDTFGWEVTYDTHETDIRVGMYQEVNLETEFGIPAATDMLVERVVMRQLDNQDWRSTVTLTSNTPGRTWERDMREALTVGQKPRTLQGTHGLPRYLRV